MTNHVGGSSLLQARNNHHHNHNRHRHLHSPHPHQQDQQHVARGGLVGDESNTNNNHIRSSPEDKKLHAREVVVVQTVAVVHVVDATGAVISVATILSDAVTRPPSEPVAGVTAAGLSALGNALPSVSASAPQVSGDGAPSSTAASARAESTPLSLSSGQETVTPAPSSSSATSFPTFSSSGGFNSSSVRFPSLFNNSTSVHSFYTNSTKSSSSTRSKQSSKSQSITATTTLNLQITTPAAGAGGDGAPGVGGGATAPAQASATGTGSPSPGLTPAAQSAVIGGVVGSIAGIAIIALFLMFIIKWKKRQGGKIMLLGDGGDSPLQGRGQPSGSGGGGGMMSQRSIPFAIPSALAKLSGNKRIAEGPADEPSSGERGFYRVSGKKLLPVLQSGGDGYSDPSDRQDRNPHDSTMSGASYYRDSQAFFDDAPRLQLQLGSPMRPESGVPIMRSGPGRTPVKEQAAFFSDHRPLTPPTIDPLGRSLMPQAGSRGSGGSGSRFTEDT
ncbi:hypothetical protein B0T26DRAFT_672843 [Lasiosphaeria miniovina]|uniref:Uncharacterized protein n=1 Tax=Lasiosphaeria miniovina TaxID=1954250 RepID=A0AA40B5X3_9PEZI|nr:uncharacterized protein B0T26DRAFT_672843 [Lasiosphaeria miniovina]KAK0728291.1 hypothetical protein B0T26DRAFT_672843 [Lasiosphaeria miniovina]